MTIATTSTVVVTAATPNDRRDAARSSRSTRLPLLGDRPRVPPRSPPVAASAAGGRSGGAPDHDSVRRPRRCRWRRWREVEIRWGETIEVGIAGAVVTEGPDAEGGVGEGAALLGHCCIMFFRCVVVKRWERRAMMVCLLLGVSGTKKTL
jgi:hypothetical protein